MGARVWSFLRPRPGELRPLAQSALDAFFFREGRLPADEDGFVCYFEVVVLFNVRRAVEVIRVSCFRHRALKNGTLDRRRLMEMMSTVGEAAFGHLTFSKSPPGVIQAEHKFARRRLDRISRWTPTRGELAKLRDLVNRRAGHEIM